MTTPDLIQAGEPLALEFGSDVVHRDYSTLGPTVIQITEDEFSVSNPGGLPPGVTVGNILDQSRPRSPILADAFKRAGLVDRRGKGVNDMFEQHLRADRDVPDYARSMMQSVVVAVPLLIVHEASCVSEVQ